MSRTWYTADPHFGHVNIAKHAGRPWPDVTDGDAALVANWNAVVGLHDTTYILGDLAMGRIAETIQVVRRLNGTKILLPGNHDRMHSSWKKGRADARALYESVGLTIADEQVQHTLTDEVTGKSLQVLMCHFPYAGDHTAHERYPEHRPAYRGQWLLHGHIHQHGFVNRERRSINVGVDVPAWNYTPVAEQTLVDIILGRGAA